MALTLGLSLASSTAFAQGGSAQASRLSQDQIQRIPGPIRHAGIYHVASGTWTRNGGAVANFGPDTVYTNNALTGYFVPLGGTGGTAPNIAIDEGGLLTQPCLQPGFQVPTLAGLSPST